MIHYAEINGKKYPFKFGMREVWKLSTGEGLEFDDTLKAIHLDFGLFLKLFVLANKKGARRHVQEVGEGKEEDFILTAEEIEDAVDDHPEVFDDLSEAFTESSAFKRLEGNLEKKRKEATVNHSPKKG